MLIRARALVPMTSPPVENGAVLIRNGVIQEVGSWEALRHQDPEVVDLGEVALLPGLINAHCHLDYTGMAGQVPPTRDFTDWIKLITTLKSTWSLDEFARSWETGAQMLLRNGTTLVADIEAIPELLPQAWCSTPLRIISFLEMTGVKSRRNPEEILRESCRRIEACPPGRCQAGLSPHAPYSTTPKLLQAAAETARQRGWFVTTHVAESIQEYEMFMFRRGSMFEWLRRNEREMHDCGHGSPVRHLEHCGLLGPNFLAVHVNYLWDGDAEILARHQVTVVHCPASHEFFGHRRFPLETFRRAGVNVCLGTDSLASTRVTKQGRPELSLFHEMQTLLRWAPGLDPKEVLSMVTLAPARALGLAQLAGGLFAGARADMVAVPFSGRTSSLYESVVRHAGPVRASMIDGQWVCGPFSHE